MGLCPGVFPRWGRRKKGTGKKKSSSKKRYSNKGIGKKVPVKKVHQTAQIGKKGNDIHF